MIYPLTSMSPPGVSRIQRATDVPEPSCARTARSAPAHTNPIGRGSAGSSSGTDQNSCRSWLNRSHPIGWRPTRGTARSTLVLQHPLGSRRGRRFGPW